MEHPVEFVHYVAVQLGAYQPFRRGEHVMIFRVAGTGGIKKSDSTWTHKKSIRENIKIGYGGSYIRQERQARIDALNL
jgi:hypothetical protein